MALVLKDRVKETSTSTGTGNFVLAGAATGFQSFASALADGDTTYYAIEDGTDWETGLGTWAESTSTLSRTTVYESSNSGNAVDWVAGTKNVFITQPASRVATTTVYASADDLPLSGNVQAGDQAFVTGNNRLYLFNGSGWYNIALINLTPTIDTQPDANYNFGTSGTALTVTLTATDPEGFPLTWSANTTGMTGLATLSQNNNAFTFTPSTDAADQGQSFTATFSVTDGINTAVSNQATFTIGIDQLAEPSVGTLTITSPTGQAVFIAGLSELWKDANLSIGTSATNGLDNSTFIDRSTNALTVTPTGSPVQTAFHPYLENWSVKFDGVGDFLDFDAASAEFDLGANNFTFECWVNFNDTSEGCIVSKHTTATAHWLELRLGSSNKILTQVASGTNWTISYSSTSSVEIGNWYHIALVRDGNTFTTYIDGQSEGTATNSLTISNNTSYPLRLGARGGEDDPLNGSISNLRLVKGTALYTANFTPPTEKLTAVSGTSLLTCQSNRFIDSSGVDIKYDFASSTLVTSLDINPPESLPNGVHFSPDGTRMYIAGDGTNSVHEYVLSTAWAIGTATLTETFSVLDQESGINGVFFKPDGTRMYIVGVSGDTVDSYTLSTAWDLSTASYDSASFSVVQQDGTPRDLYIRSDGLRLYIVGDTGNTAEQYTFGTAWDVTSLSHDTTYGLVYETNPSGIFFSEDGLQMFVAGYSGDDITVYSLSTAWDLSTASYVTEYDAVPDLPAVNGIFVSPDGKRLFACGTSNDTVYEYSIGQEGNPITVTGDPAISAFNPFGQDSEYAVGENKGSTYFGDNAEVDIPHDGTQLDLRDNPFTIECWFYANDYSTSPTLFAQADQVNDTSTVWINADATIGVQYYVSGTNRVLVYSPALVKLNVWHHIAVVCDGDANNTGRVYFDGEQVLTWTNSYNWGDGSFSSDFSIGYNSYAGNRWLDGYIADFRITNGTARYTSNFTLPTAPVGNTGASLYLPFDNAGIFDKTGNTTLVVPTEAASGAPLTDTSITKYSSSSMNFGTTSDDKLWQVNGVPPLGSGPFTIEGWIYPTNVDGTWQSVITRDYGATGGWRLYKYSSNPEFVWYRSTTSTLLTDEATKPLVNNTWQHFAVCRDENDDLRIFIDGVQTGPTVANTYDYSAADPDNPLNIGSGGKGDASGYPFSGNLEGIQVFVGLAKYTSNFTVPDREQGRNYQTES